MDNLRDFRNDPSLLPESDDMDSLQSPKYQKDTNTRKIEKLSNRITIISVIIPCLICAILIFAYLDMKARVGDADETKRLQVENLARQLEEKLNAFDVRLAKAIFDVEQQVPQLAKKQTALENQVTKMSTSKADAKPIEAAMETLDKKLQTSAGLTKANKSAIEDLNQKILTSVKENTAQFTKTTAQIKEEITLFKKEVAAKLVEFSASEEQIGQLRKTTSLLDKKFNAMESETLSKRELDKRFSQMQQSLEQKIKAIETKLEKRTNPPLVKAADKAMETKKDLTPVPQLDTGKSGSISEQPLKQ